MYYISPDNEYPRHIGDIQIEHPGYKMGDPLPEGWTWVRDVPKPPQEDGKIIEELFPVEIDGKMSRNWNIREMTAEESERLNAPSTAKAKLVELGFTEFEIDALIRGMIR
jgi:hypothetical protein